MLMAAAMMVSLVACAGDNGENSETPVSSGNDVVEETEANHITLAESWGFENFYTIMTPDVSASNFGITYYLSNFYDVLVEYQDGEYVGGLAEDWKISEDGTVYTFNLRHDVKFSDGSDLTAEDVAKSLLAVPINLGQYNGTYGRLSTIIEDAVVVDDYTVEMHLTQPYYNALRELCLANPFGIVSSEQLNDDLTKKDTFETATYGTKSLSVLHFHKTFIGDVRDSCDKINLSVFQCEDFSIIVRNALDRKTLNIRFFTPIVGIALEIPSLPVIISNIHVGTCAIG